MHAIVNHHYNATYRQVHQLNPLPFGIDRVIIPRGKALSSSLEFEPFEF